MSGVLESDLSAVKDLVIGQDYDRIDATYPTSTKEVYTYSLAGSTVLALEVIYLTASKKDIEAVVVI